MYLLVQGFIKVHGADFEVAAMNKKQQAQYRKGQIYNVNWMHTDYLEYWLQQFTIQGSTLNVCSGMSMIGQVRVDKDPETNRTMDGDLFHLLDYFKPNQFDYVYVDPPFNVYTSGMNRIRWQFDAFKICKKALITRRPKVTANIPSKYHDYIIAEDTRPSLTILRVDYK